MLMLSKVLFSVLNVGLSNVKAQTKKRTCSYLIFVTSTTSGARVNFYRFNAKKWHFFTDLTRKIGVFRCKFYSPKILPV